MIALSRILLAIVALASAILPETDAAGISIPRSFLNATNVGLEERQSYPSYTNQGLLNGSPSSVPYNDITCDAGNWDSCWDDVTYAIQGAMNNYASVINAWYNAGGPGGYGGDSGYVTGASGGIVCTVAFANPPYFEGDQAEQWLAKWNSYEAAVQIMDFMYDQQTITACVEPWDWLASSGNQQGTAFVGDVLVMLGWNNQGYNDPDYLEHFFNCN